MLKKILELDNSGMSGRDIAITLSTSRNSVAEVLFLARRHLLIQHSTLTKAYHGSNVEFEWAKTLCDRTKLPFDLLFIRQREVEEYAFRTKHQRKIMLRQMLAYAKRQRVIKENYATADFVFYTRNKTIHQIQAMDEEQAKKFYIALNECDDIRVKTSLLFIDRI